MGRASSKKKSVARARQLSSKSSSRRNWTWPLALGGTVVLLAVLVVFSAVGRDNDETPPTLGEHWHAAYGVYNCGQWAPFFNDVKPDASGIHSHGDGLIHMHPFATRYTGEGANLAAFADQVGLELTDTTMIADGIRKKNGDKCGAKKASVRLVVWDNLDDDTPTEIRKDIAKYAPQNNQILTLAFVPDDVKTADIPQPPSIANLQDPTAAERGEAPAVQEPTGTTTTTAAGTDQSIPIDQSTTTTSAPAESTTTTAAP